MTTAASDRRSPPTTGAGGSRCPWSTTAWGPFRRPRPRRVRPAPPAGALVAAHRTVRGRQPIRRPSEPDDRQLGDAGGHVAEVGGGGGGARLGHPAAHRGGRCVLGEPAVPGRPGHGAPVRQAGGRRWSWTPAGRPSRCRGSRSTKWPEDFPAWPRRRRGWPARCAGPAGGTTWRSDDEASHVLFVGEVVDAGERGRRHRRPGTGRTTAPGVLRMEDTRMNYGG